MKTTIIDYKNYGKCLQITNEIIELVATLDVGPRIVHFSFVGGRNILHSNREIFTPLGGEEFDKFYFKGAVWENLGGHRLWISPESLPETYYPDTKPIKYDISGNTVKLYGNDQKENGVATSIEITLEDNSSSATILNKAKNISDSNKEFALWPITVLDVGGIEIIPQNTEDTGLLPNRFISLWPYTNVKDSRLNVGNKYITIQQDINCKAALKIGTSNNSGLAYYVLDDVVFKKQYTHNPNGNYPDGGVSFETYTNDEIIECESLSELKIVKPQEEIEHKEVFSLYKKTDNFNINDENSIDEFLKNLQ